MAELDLNKSTTTDFTSQVDDFSVATKTLDKQNEAGDEFYHYFDKATTNYGYYLTIPEIFSAANNLTTWAVGRGWTTEDKKMQAQLEHVSGMGNDYFDKIIWNHQLMKVIVGDALTEVKKANGIIINMLPIDPDNARIVFQKNGLIKRYDVWSNSKWKQIQKENMLHSSNKRIGNQVHGQSQIEPAKFIIDARNEALADERIIKRSEERRVGKECRSRWSP